MVKILPKLSVILFIFIIIAAMIIASAHANNFGYNDIEVQEPAANAYERLINLFTASRATGDKLYPDYYGGSFITDDGKLTIYVTTTNSVDMNFFAPLPVDTVEYKECQYSYSQLKNIMNTLNNYKLGNPSSEIAKNFNQFGLFDADNRIIVFLDDLSDEKIQSFKTTVHDSDAIVFKQSVGAMVEEISINPGAEITDANGIASIGFRARRNGVGGFVTAAHFAINLGEAIFCNGADMAICVARQRAGSVDAAFCEVTNSDYTPTNTLNGTDNTLSTKIREPGVGSIVNKIGRTTGHTYGAIVSTDYTALYSDGTVLTNLTQASYDSEPGDSGGIVYMYFRSREERLTLGIHTSSNGTYACYTKANEINLALETSRY
ncbi:MAG: S1 family peptidase [Clostridiales bacterium]|jgi:streptogrisin B|nr:S1 family peptidase [Clostridiales bacterium]